MQQDYVDHAVRRVRWTAALWLVQLLFSAGPPVKAQQDCADTPEGRICTDEQALIAGTLVSTDEQRELGLVSVGGRCSGTLLNRLWVLTADHCVTVDGTVGGPETALADLVVTATWSKHKVIPQRVVRRWYARSRDVALVFLGAGVFGEVPVQRISSNAVYRDDWIVAYGRGIHALARGTGPRDAVPVQYDGRYRAANLRLSAADIVEFSFVPNTNAQIIAGGDSGGPDIVFGSDGTRRIVGVHSRCSYDQVPGMPHEWTWAANITRCISASVISIRDEIETISREGLDPCPDVSAGCAIQETAAHLLLRN